MRLLVILVCLVSISLVSTIIIAQGSRQPLEIIVQPGDTLWKIAREYKADSDPRRTIDEIRYLNNLHDVRLQPGQRLLIP
ncbi:MAG: LysM peptidoglycan-binding domain-containing protein [Limnochordia bacterium]